MDSLSNWRRLRRIRTIERIYDAVGDPRLNPRWQSSTTRDAPLVSPESWVRFVLTLVLLAIGSSALSRALAHAPLVVRALFAIGFSAAVVVAVDVVMDVAVEPGFRALHRASGWLALGALAVIVTVVAWQARSPATFERLGTAARSSVSSWVAKKNAELEARPGPLVSGATRGDDWEFLVDGPRFKRLSYPEAASACQGKGAGWRLPSMADLQTRTLNRDGPLMYVWLGPHLEGQVGPLNARGVTVSAGPADESQVLCVRGDAHGD